METPLKNCPLCNGAAELRFRPRVDLPPTALIACLGCHVDIERPSKSEAVAAWNRRASPVSGERTVCGHQFDDGSFCARGVNHRAPIPTTGAPGPVAGERCYCCRESGCDGLCRCYAAPVRADAQGDVCSTCGTRDNSAADVANFAMMIADVCGGLPKLPRTPGEG